MAAEPIESGPTAKTVRANVERLMKARGMTTSDLSAELGRIGRPILPTGVTKVLKGNRRVDVDDLMALAIALRVNPNALLLPHTREEDTTYDVTGASGIDPETAWYWADGDKPLFDPDDDATDLDFQLHARPIFKRVFRNLPGRVFGDAPRHMQDFFPELDLSDPEAWHAFRHKALPEDRPEEENRG